MRPGFCSDISNKFFELCSQRLNPLFHPAVLPVFPALFFLSFYWDVFITRESVMTHDSIFWYGSFNYFLLCLAQFELPLWDPYSFSGTPFFMEYNTQALLDPTVLVLVPLIWLWDFSVLDLFHWHYGFLLFVYFTGTYALALHLSKNKWAALLGATLLLFVVGGNGFRQHGLWSSAAYSPLILLFLLRLVSPVTKAADRKYFFLTASYLIGLSLNIYIPSYLFVFLSLAFLYLCVAYQFRKGRHFFSMNQHGPAGKWIGSALIFVGSFFMLGAVLIHGSPPLKSIIVPLLVAIIFFLTLRLPLVRKIFFDIGWKNVLAGLTLFAILTAPFFYSLSQIMPGDAENFGYARANLKSKFHELAHLENDAVSSPSDTYRIGLDSLMSVIFPFPDLRYFMAGRNMQEVIPLLGIVPILVVFLFFNRTVSIYKGLCLFLVISLGLIMAGPDILFHSFLKYFPGLTTIRVVYNFFGFFYIIWSTLFAICLSGLIQENAVKNTPDRRWMALLVIGFLHAEAVYYYLTGFNVTVTSKPYMKHVPWLEHNFLSHSWILAFAYGFLFILFFSRSRIFRNCCILALVFLSLFQMVELCVKLKSFTVQPALYSDKGYVHYNRKFEYKPIRTPVAPGLGTLSSYLPALYRLPVVGPMYGGDYIILRRRTFDYLRVASIENIGLVSAMGKRRFGFFDGYYLARNSVDALMHVGGLPKEVLKNTLVLEESEPVEPLIHLKKIRKVDLPPLKAPRENPLGSQTKLYSIFMNINFLGLAEPKDGGLFRSIPIPDNYFLLNWAWDRPHLGYFLIMTRHLNLTPYYRVLGNSSFITVSLDANKKNDFCFSLFQQNGLFEDRKPQLSIREQYPYYCALRINNESLEVNETYWANVTNNGTFNMNALAPAYPGVTLWLLDPRNVTAEKSPYARDEETEVLDFGPNHIRFKINNSKPGLFYYADSYSKHWKAWIDGQSTSVLRANFNFKAVSVDEGEHIVEFRFDPWLFKIFMIVFILVSIPGMSFPILTLFKKDRCN